MSDYPPILIFGGSFDPPHRGHIDIPQEVAGAIGASKIIYIPTGTPPHKEREITRAHFRINMLRYALVDYENAELNTIEIDRGGVSYMVDTLECLKETYTLQPLRLLIGGDMAGSFYSWREPERIIELAEPVVMVRPPETIDDVISKLPAELSDEEREKWRGRFVEVHAMEISSTRIRELIRTKQPHPELTTMLHPDVLNYIQKNRLYAE